MHSNHLPASQGSKQKHQRQTIGPRYCRYFGINSYWKAWFGVSAAMPPSHRACRSRVGVLGRATIAGAHSSVKSYGHFKS